MSTKMYYNSNNLNSTSYHQTLSMALSNSTWEGNAASNNVQTTNLRTRSKLKYAGTQHSQSDRERERERDRERDRSTKSVEEEKSEYSISSYKSAYNAGYDNGLQPPTSPIGNSTSRKGGRAVSRQQQLSGNGTMNISGSSQQYQHQTQSQRAATSRRRNKLSAGNHHNNNLASTNTSTVLQPISTAVDQNQLPVIPTKRPPTTTTTSISKFDGGGLEITTEEHHQGAVSSIRGLKPGNPNWINQDNFFVAENIDDRDFSIYCVLDGHGEVGHLVSRHCRETFPGHIIGVNFDMKKAFLNLQGELMNGDIDARCSGATCTMVIVYRGKLITCNCGDSRAVLGRRMANGSFTAVQLSTDHKPDNPEERKRVINAGGHLGCRQAMVNQAGKGLVSVPVGPTRVWYQFRGDTLGLAMSRSLGDIVVHRCGVSAEPEITEQHLAPSDEFVIIATDGVWDVVDNMQAVQIVQNFSSKSPHWSPLEAALWLTKFARSRWEKMSPMVDDITCVIIKLSALQANTVGQHQITYQQSQQQGNLPHTNSGGQQQFNQIYQQTLQPIQGGNGNANSTGLANHQPPQSLFQSSNTTSQSTNGHSTSNHGNSSHNQHYPTTSSQYGSGRYAPRR